MTAPHGSYNWTDELIERIKREMLEGKSAKQIADGLPGTPSRNAVIGKLHRLGMKAGGKPRGGQREKRKRAERTIKIRSFVPAIVCDVTPVSPEAVDGNGVEFLQLRPHHCRSVRDDRGSDGLAKFCGKPRVEVDGALTSWCAEHYRRYRTPPQPRKHYG